MDGWPEPVRDYLRSSHGEPAAVEKLGGMSLGQVWRIRFAGGSVIVKSSPSDREMAFYRSVAGTLSDIGVAIPRLEWSGSFSGLHWLILEDIPQPLPRSGRDHWRADPRVLETLGRLHTAPFELPDEMSTFFEPRWTAEMTAAALSLFPARAAECLGPVLESLRREAQRLFAPDCYISGDPNPANWGLRGHGTAVLFDWERFGRGTPPLDLAISVPGLGDRATYERLASDYIALRARRSDAPPGSAHDLARDISIAKVWTVVEFMANHAAVGSDATGEVVRWLVDAVPVWLDSVAR